MAKQERRKSWSHRLVRLVREEFMHKTGRSFERHALPWARAVWPTLVLDQPLGAIDRGGIDGSVGIDRSPIPVVVQFKGFEIGDDELGDQQIKNCENSITDFKSGPYRAIRYVLIHNRSARNRDFSTRLAGLVDDLVACGHCDQAEVWSLKEFLDQAMTSLLYRFIEFAASRVRRRTGRDFLPAFGPFDEPLTSVPFRTGTMQADPNALRIPTGTLTSVVGDPLQALRGQDVPRICVVLGEFGFGKSTLLQRLAASYKGPVVLAHGALLDPDPRSSKEFLVGCLSEGVEDFLEKEIPEPDREALRRVLPVVVDQSLKQEGHFDAVIVDAVDESDALERPGGGQQMFNSIRDVRTKVVLGMRTEFWRRKEPTFARGFGDIATKKPRRVMKISRMELVEWGNEQILEFARRYRAVCDGEAVRHVNAFINLVENGGYQDLYGDIPRRPLFLGFVLDSAATEGLPLHPLRRAKLLLRWTKLKITRDYEAPAAAGGQGRPPLSKYRRGSEETIGLAMLLMRKASRCMSYVEGEQIIQRPNCRLEQVRRADRELEALGSDVGVLLNSLLQEHFDNPITGLHVRFAHRIFQDFFLGWELVMERDAFGPARPPKDVSDWYAALQEAESLDRVTSKN